MRAVFILIGDAPLGAVVAWEVVLDAASPLPLVARSPEIANRALQPSAAPRVKARHHGSVDLSNI